MSRQKIKTIQLRSMQTQTQKTKYNKLKVNKIKFMLARSTTLQGIWGIYYANSKGQTNSKWFFQADVSSKKTKRTDSTLLLVNLFFFIFGKKVKTPKRHFEIIWPLSAPIVLLWVPCPWFPFYDHYFYKKLSLCIHIHNIYLGLEFEFGPQIIMDLAFVCP